MSTSFIARFLIFLIINFLALGLGGRYTATGVPSDWYQALNKAPWTPPGWVFGFAWTTVMLTFTAYMAVAWAHTETKYLLLLLFALQWLLNVAWSPVFFKYQAVGAGLLIIATLLLLILYFIAGYWPRMQWHALWALPYALWLSVATSLNAYILLKN